MSQRNHTDLPQLSPDQQAKIEEEIRADRAAGRGWFANSTALRERRTRMSPPTKNDDHKAELRAPLSKLKGAVERATETLERDDQLERSKQVREMKARVDQIRVMREALTYRPDGRHGYYRDLLKARMSPEAHERLERNNREAEIVLKAAGVNQTATSGGEFVPPTWVLEDHAPALRNGRTFLNALGTRNLAARSMTNQLDVPKFSTGASTDTQLDGAAVSNTDPTTALVTGQYQTAAGRTVASQQFVDLDPRADLHITADLFYSLNTTLDAKTLATSSATNAKSVLNTTGVNTVTYTDASPTGPEFSTPVGQAASAIGKNGAMPSFAVTHPSIWFYIAHSLDPQSRPLYLDVGSGKRVLGTNPSSDDLPELPGETDGLIGNIAGIPVCVDPNMPTNLGGGTNESRVVVLNRLGFDVYESTPVLRVADQTNTSTLQVQFVAVCYFVCLSRQPKLISIVSGTGCVPQAGW